MGRTPGDLDDIFAAADANDGKLTKEIFDEHDGSDVMTYGNAQRRYKRARWNAGARADSTSSRRGKSVISGAVLRQRAHIT